MSYGITILNQSGFVQITQDFSNYAAVSHGYVETGADFVNDGYGVVNYSVAAPPLVLVRPPYGRYVTAVYNPTTATFRLCHGYGDTRMSVEYYLMERRIDQTAPSGYGLAVFDSAGKPTYSSNETYATFDSVASVNNTLIASGVYGPQTQTFSLPAPGRRRFFVANPLLFSSHYQWGSPIMGSRYCAMMKIDSETTATIMTGNTFSGYGVQGSYGEAFGSIELLFADMP